MPTTRKRRRRTENSLKPWELAFLTGDLSYLRPGTRDTARFKTLKADPDGFLIFGDRTSNQLQRDGYVGKN